MSCLKCIQQVERYKFGQLFYVTLYNLMVPVVCVLSRFSLRMRCWKFKLQHIHTHTHICTHSGRLCSSRSPSISCPPFLPPALWHITIPANNQKIMTRMKTQDIRGERKGQLKSGDGAARKETPGIMRKECGVTTPLGPAQPKALWLGNNKRERLRSAGCTHKGFNSTPHIRTHTHTQTDPHKHTHTLTPPPFLCRPTGVGCCCWLPATFGRSAPSASPSFPSLHSLLPSLSVSLTASELPGKMLMTWHLRRGPWKKWLPPTLGHIK